MNPASLGHQSHRSSLATVHAARAVVSSPSRASSPSPKSCFALPRPPWVLKGGAVNSVGSIPRLVAGAELLQ